MKVFLRLYGTLPQYFQGDYPESGLVIEIWDGATVEDLVDLIHFPREKVSLISINGLLAKAGDVIPAKAVVKFFQPISGG